MFFLPLFDDNPTNSKPFVSWFIILTCVLIYIWQCTLDDIGAKIILYKYGMIPSVLFNNYNQIPKEFLLKIPILSVFTSMFLHGGIMHLFSNMLYIWIFSDNVEDKMGKLKFILFYLLCGFFASVTQSFIDPTSNVPMIGASGGIAGILGAYIILFPKASVRVFLLIIIFFRIVSFPAWLVLGIWILIQFLNAPINITEDGGVAYFAHIGGFVSGMILIFLFKKPETSLLKETHTSIKNITKPISLNDLKKEAKIRYKSYIPSVKRK